MIWEVQATPAAVIDGDTFDALVEVWPGWGGFPHVVPERIRVMGVQTPERGELGYKEAKDFTAKWVGERVYLHVAGRDRAGRILARVSREDRQYLDVELVLKGLGKKVDPYL